jgi:hypothetical protein
MAVDQWAPESIIGAERDEQRSARDYMDADGDVEVPSPVEYAPDAELDAMAREHGRREADRRRSMAQRQRAEGSE